MVWPAAGAFDLFFFLRALKQPETPGLDTLCVVCGYDLRGSGENVACPECGVLIAVEQRQLLRPIGSAAPAP
jgi:hypothetical protein